MTRSFRAASRRPPAVTVYFPVSAPSPSTSGRTLNDCSSPRRAISSAKSSTLTPALIRRTFASDATSLSSAISLATASVIFDMSFNSAKGRPEPLSRPFSLRRARRALSLSGCRLPRSADRQVAHISAGASVGLCDHDERRIRKRVPGQWIGRPSYRYHRPRIASSATLPKSTLRLSITGKPAAIAAALTVSQS